MMRAMNESSTSVTFGVGGDELAFDADERLWRGGEEVQLPPRVRGVLAELLRRPGQLVSRQELMDAVWQDTAVSYTSLAEAVSLLRTSLGDDAQKPRYVRTVPRRGYVFVAPVARGTSTPPRGVPRRTSRRMSLLAVSAAMAMAAVVVIAGWQWFPPASSESPTPPAGTVAVRDTAAIRFSIPAPEGGSFRLALPALSPDGRRLAYSVEEDGVRHLRLRELGSFESVVLPGTEDGLAPFFSPDGRELGFLVGNHLKKMTLPGPGPSGSLPVTLSHLPVDVGASWGDDGEIVVAKFTGGLMALPENGGVARTLVVPRSEAGEDAYLWPDVLPGSRAVVFARMLVGPFPPSVAVLDRGSGEVRTLVEHGSFPRYVRPSRPGEVGHLLYVTEEALFAVPFDASALRIVGEPKVVLTGLEIDPWYGFPQAAVSAAGVVAYMPGASSRSARRLCWLGGDSELTDSGLPPRFYRNVDASSDGRFAVTIRDGHRSDVWIADPETVELRRFTFRGFNIEPYWSHDAAWIAYASSEGGPLEVRLRAADGRSPARSLVSGPRHHFPVAWTPDDRAVAYCELHPERGADLWLQPLAPGAPAEPLRVTAAQELDADFSPDGRFFAFSSDESGSFQVYVEELATGGRWQVSESDSLRPRWSSDGRRLYFLGLHGLKAVDVTTDGELRFSRPRRLFEGPRFVRHEAVPGGRVVVVEEDDVRHSRELRVIVDWFSEWR